VVAVSVSRLPRAVVVVAIGCFSFTVRVSVQGWIG
jgi:hypothetical protein